MPRLRMKGKRAVHFKFTAKQLQTLHLNWSILREDSGADLTPVVSLFQVLGEAKRLLIALDPQDFNMAYGIADLGMGCVEEGIIMLDQVRAIPCPLGLGVELERRWKAGARTSAYIAEGARTGRLDKTLQQPSQNGV